MTDMIDVSPRVGVFFGEMLRKLSDPENQNKRDWRGYSAKWILTRIEEELAEVREAMERKDGVAVAEECADVANFAFMLADMCKTHADSAISWDA